MAGMLQKATFVILLPLAATAMALQLPCGHTEEAKGVLLQADTSIPIQMTAAAHSIANTFTQIM